MKRDIRNNAVAGSKLVALVLMAAWMPTGAGAWTHDGNTTIGGKWGVGTEQPVRGLHLQSHSGIFEIDRDADPAAFLMVRTAPGDFSTVHKAYLFGVKGPGVNNGEFTIRDMGATAGGSGGAKRLTIANDGRVALGDLAVPLAWLHVKSPVAGDILRLDDGAGNDVFRVEEDGDMDARGADLELRLATATPGGYGLMIPSTLLANTGTADDEAFIALNANTALICSSGELGLLRILSQNGYSTNYTFWRSLLDIQYAGDYSIRNHKQGEGEELKLSTTGEEIQFYSDVDNNTIQVAAYSWYCNGSGAGSKHMELVAEDGTLNVKGALSQNHAFDLAEAYWKSEEGIEAGDVVCFDPAEPHAVTLAREAGDRTVVGVVSTDPGLVMGGGAFSTGHLEELWGEEIGARFAGEREQIEQELLQTSEYLKGREAKMGAMKARLAKDGRGGDRFRLIEEIAREQVQLEEIREELALRKFCEEHLARVALAGRVPVKVDASYGAIRAGDLLVASATPGHAMRSEQPGMGTVIGKAMEALASGQGTIMMMVLNR